MLSFITTHTHIPNSHRRFSRLSCVVICPLNFEINSRVRARNLKKAAVLSRYIGFQELRGPWRFERNPDSYLCCGSKQTEGDAELESEIMEFMANSEKPNMFPTKTELIQAGRVDLVEAIKKRGGWYSLGWDDNDAVEEGIIDFDIGEFLRSVDDCEESASLRRQHWDDSSSAYEKGDDFSSDSDSNSGSLESGASSASGSLEFSANEDAGIEGILNRLEKQRNSDFGINIEGNVYKAHAEIKDGEENRHFDASLGVGGNGIVKLGNHPKGVVNASAGKSSQNMEQETWRTWSNQRSGTVYTEFEAAEISFGKNRVETDEETYHDGIAVTATEEIAEDVNQSQIRTRLQHLESELNSALHSLRSKRQQCIEEEVTKSSGDVQKLSDTIEFQENELMSAQERLRLIRAKLAVLEGKMTLAVNDAQRLVEVKQKRINDAHKALQLLRTTSIGWPNSASEVLLSGSFDGWTTKRKMEKSKTGIFSVSLKLYPGRYEIKFIVDGVWKVDPLRPVVNNNGYVNNLLIIT